MKENNQWAIKYMWRVPVLFLRIRQTMKLIYINGLYDAPLSASFLSLIIWESFTNDNVFHLFLLFICSLIAFFEKLTRPFE